MRDRLPVYCRLGAFEPATGRGYVPAVTGEYAGALARSQTVSVLLTEITGATHPGVRSFHRELAAAYTARTSGVASTTSPRARSFLSFNKPASLRIEARHWTSTSCSSCSSSASTSSIA